MPNEKDLESKIPNLKIIDPVGAIRSRAKILFQEAGAPSGKDWTDFFETAEQEMIGRGVPSQQPRQRPAQPVVTPSAMMKAAAASDDTIISIVGAGMENPLNEHEALELGYILMHNEIKLNDESLIKAHSALEAAEILVEVSDDYRPDFLQVCKVSTGMEAPKEKRIAYWEDLLSEAERKDEALTNLDRLTIQRIVKALRASNRIKDIKYVQR